MFFIFLLFLSLAYDIYVQHSDWAGEIPPVLSKNGHLPFFQNLLFADNFQFCHPLISSDSLLLYHALVRGSTFSNFPS